MQLAVGDPIPLSVYFPDEEGDLEFRATVVTRNPSSILVSDVELDPVSGHPGLWALEIESMPNVAVIDIHYTGNVVGQPEIIYSWRETFSRSLTIVYDSSPLVGIIDEG